MRSWTRLLISMNSRLRFAPRLLLALISTGCTSTTDQSPPTQAPAVTLLAESHPLPYSANTTVALVGTDLACIIVSYDVTVECGDREWKDTFSAGSPGQGPGEFGSPYRVVRGADGRFGVLDGNPSRMTVYDGEGKLLATIPTPFLFMPLSAFSSETAYGTFTVLGERRAGLLVATLSMHDGAILAVDTLLHPSELGQRTEAERGLSGGARHPSGDLVFGTGTREIVRYDGDGQLVDAFPAPAFSPELPNERDVEEHRAGMASAFAGIGQDALNAFASEPKAYKIRGRSMVFDHRGRLWVATQRDRDEFSYIDVYEESDLLGSVRLRDRLLGFDIGDSLLVVLVERSTTDGEGLPIRALDWYSIEDGDQGLIVP